MEVLILVQYFHVYTLFKKLKVGFVPAGRRPAGAFVEGKCIRFERGYLRRQKSQKDWMGLRYSKLGLLLIKSKNLLIYPDPFPITIIYKRHYPLQKIKRKTFYSFVDI